MEFIKKNKKYIIWIAVTLLLGGLGALLSGGFDYYKMLDKPPLSPPSFLFPIVWTLLYIVLGFSAGIIADSSDLDSGKALKVYICHLVINLLWPVIFFKFEAPKAALFWILLLLTAAIFNSVVFKRISQKAGLLFVPYIAWTVFALYLNFGVAVLNP